jgi:N-acetylmuramoyl-L-alanine amidase
MNAFRRILAILSVVAALPGTAFAAKTVVIDAGHGGHDRGGIPRQRLTEKIYTLDVARRL